MNSHEIFHQEAVLKVLQNQQDAHHSFLFYGREGVGKFSTAVFFAKLILCEKINSNQTPCNSCSSCSAIFKFSHPNLVMISSDDRLPYLKFYLQQIQQGKKKFIEFLYSEIYLLLYRYQSCFLSILEKEKKKDFPEGFPLKNKKAQEKMEEKLNEIKKTLKFCIQNKDFSQLNEESFLQDITQLQNCLDRSRIKKENISKLFSHLQIYQKKKRIVIINDINKMEASVIGGFLKILEEPPPNTIFLLLSKNNQNIDSKVVLPLLSRCVRLKFNTLNKNQVQDILMKKFKINVAEEEKLANNLKTTFNFLSSSDSVQKIVKEIFNKKINGQKISISDAVKHLAENKISSKKFIEEAKQLLKKTISSADEKFYFKFRTLQKIIYDAEKTLATGRMKEENVLIEFLIRFYQFC